MGRIVVPVLPACTARDKGPSNSHTFMINLAMANAVITVLPQASDNGRLPLFWVVFLTEQAHSSLSFRENLKMWLKSILCIKQIKVFLLLQFFYKIYKL